MGKSGPHSVINRKWRSLLVGGSSFILVERAGGASRRGAQSSAASCPVLSPINNFVCDIKGYISMLVDKQMKIAAQMSAALLAASGGPESLRPVAPFISSERCLPAAPVPSIFIAK